MAGVIENGRSFKGLVFFERGAKGFGGLTVVVVVRALFELDIVNDATVKELVKDVNKLIIGLRLKTLFMTSLECKQLDTII